MMALQDDQELLKKANEKQREALERTIKQKYETVLYGILAEIAMFFAKFEKDGKLAYEEMAKLGRLRKLEKDITSHVNELSAHNRNALMNLLRSAYGHSYEWMAWAIEKESLAKLAYSAVRLEVIDAAIQNPMTGLTLNERLSRNRAAVIDSLRREITQGLVQGDTYRTMASRMRETLEGDYSKSIRVVRTEANRIQNTASSAAVDQASSQGIKMTKKWLSARDEKVRRTRLANHKTLDGQTVPADAEFDLGGGRKGKAPGMTGYGAHDINCRCDAIYVVVGVERKQTSELADMTFEEWKKERLTLPNSAEPVPRSLGAAAKKIYVKVPKDVRIGLDQSGGLLKEGSYITGVLPIASGDKIRDVQRLIHSNPLPNGQLTQPSDWQKMRGDAVVIIDGVEKDAEVHWYEGKNVGKIEYKVKYWR